MDKNGLNFGLVRTCDALSYLLVNIFIRLDTKLQRQIVGIPMGTNCAALVADLVLFCYERDCMTSLCDDTQADIIVAFKSTSRYFDGLLIIDNPYFEEMATQIYPTQLQLNKVNSTDTEAPRTTYISDARKICKLFVVKEMWKPFNIKRFPCKILRTVQNMYFSRIKFLNCTWSVLKMFMNISSPV